MNEETPAKVTRLIDTNAVARRCAVKPRTVRVWAEKGILPARKVGLKLWRFEVRDVEEFLSRGQNGGVHA